MRGPKPCEPRCGWCFVAMLDTPSYHTADACGRVAFTDSVGSRSTVTPCVAARNACSAARFGGARRHCPGASGANPLERWHRQRGSGIRVCRRTLWWVVGGTDGIAKAPRRKGAKVRKGSGGAYGPRSAGVAARAAWAVVPDRAVRVRAHAVAAISGAGPGRKRVIGEVEPGARCGQLGLPGRSGTGDRQQGGKRQRRREKRAVHGVHRVGDAWHRA